MDNLKQCLYDSFSGETTEVVKNAESILKSYECSHEFCEALVNVSITQDNPYSIRIASIVHLEKIVTNYWYNALQETTKSFIFNSLPNMILSFSNFQKKLYDIVLAFLKLSIADNIFPTIYQNISSYFNSNLFIYSYFLKAIANIYNKSNDEFPQEIIIEITQNILQILSTNENESILILLSQSLKYIFQKSLNIECDYSIILQKISIFFQKKETISSKLLASAINLFYTIFPILNNNICYELSNNLISIINQQSIDQNVKNQVAKFINRIILRPEIYQSLILENFKIIFDNILRIYFIPTESDLFDFENNPISFVTNYSKSIYSFKDLRSYLYLSFHQAGRDIEGFALNMFEYVTNTPENENDRNIIFALVYILSSVISYLDDFSEQILQLVSLLFGSDDALLIIAGCIVCTEIQFEIPEELFDQLFGLISCDILLVRSYTIESLSELIDKNEGSEILEIIEEKYSDNAEEIIDCLMETVDGLNDQLLMLNCEKIISLFKNYIVSNSENICSRLFSLYMIATNDEESFVSFSSILSTIEFLLETNINETSLVLCNLINESLSSINSRNVEDVIKLVSNIVYYLPNDSLLVIPFVDVFIQFVETFSFCFESFSILMNNFILRNKSWAIENKGKLFELSHTYLVKFAESHNEFCDALRILSAIISIDNEIDISQFIALVDFENLAIFIQSRLEGAQNFFALMIIRTNGEYLQNFDIQEMLEYISMFMIPGLIKLIFNSISRFCNEQQMIELKAASEQCYDDEGDSMILEQKIISLFD